MSDNTSSVERYHAMQPATPAEQSGPTGPTKARRIRRRRKKAPDGSMSIVEHIQEFRRRLLIGLAGLLVGTIVGFIWYEVSVFGIPTLGELLRGPYCSLPPESRADFTGDGECRLLAIGVFEMFMLRVKVAALAGAVLSSPIWLYQLWAFVTPGLHKTERRFTLAFVSLAVLLFVSGAVLAYFIIAYGLEFLLTIGAETSVTALTGERYFNFLLALLLIFGVSFLVPLLIAMLNVAGVLSYDAIKDKRRMIIMLLFVFAAFMTPGQEPYSMLALAVALCLLVEIAMQFCRFNDKRRNRKRPDWMDVDDEAASALDTAPGGTDAPRPVAAPESVGPTAPVRQSANLATPQVPSSDFRRQGTSFDDVL